MDGKEKEVILKSSITDDWLLFIFPKSVMEVESLTFSQGLEIDNIKVVQYLKIINQLNYTTLSHIPLSNYEKENSTISKVDIDKFKESFPELDHIGNTLRVISDFCTEYEVEGVLEGFMK